jgi:hypothetical protein
MGMFDFDCEVRMFERIGGVKIVILSVFNCRCVLVHWQTGREATVS